MKQLLENWKNFLKNLQIDCNRQGNCDIAAKEITKELLRRGIENFKIIEGWVWLEEITECPFAHTWIEMNNGTIIDPTENQFGSSIIQRVKAKKVYQYTHPYEEYYEDEEDFWPGDCGAVKKVEINPREYLEKYWNEN